MFWYFVLLNYVKDEDLAGCSTACASLLTAVSRQLQDRLTPLEALLQTRWALGPNNCVYPLENIRGYKTSRELSSFTFVVVVVVEKQPNIREKHTFIRVR